MGRYDSQHSFVLGMTDSGKQLFSVGEMVRFEGTYLLQGYSEKQMIMTVYPRAGVIVKVLDLNAMGLEHQVLEIYSDNEVCVVRTGMPDTNITLLQGVK